MKEYRIPFIVFVITAGVICAAAGQNLNFDNGVILPLSNAKDFLPQCSRQTPQDVEGMWLPNNQQINLLEFGLKEALVAEVNKRSASNPNFKNMNYDFFRQYVGLVIGAQKIIYLNAIPAQLFRDFDGNKVNRIDWRTKPIIVCDGGPAFFGVEFDPETKVFSDFAFNGVA